MRTLSDISFTRGVLSALALIIINYYIFVFLVAFPHTNERHPILPFCASFHKILTSFTVGLSVDVRHEHTKIKGKTNSEKVNFIVFSSVARRYAAANSTAEVAVAGSTDVRLAASSNTK